MRGLVGCHAFDDHCATLFFPCARENGDIGVRINAAPSLSQLCIRYERTSKRTGKVSQEKILTCVLTLQPAAQDGVLGVMRNLLDSSVFLRKEIYAFQEVAAKKEGLEIEARKIASQKMQEEVATMAKVTLVFQL